MFRSQSLKDQGKSRTFHHVEGGTSYYTSQSLKDQGKSRTEAVRTLEYEVADFVFKSQSLKDQGKSRTRRHS